MSTTATLGTPAAILFDYVDTAVGGAFNRNHVMPLADFAPPGAARDVFATFFRFTAELADYAQANPAVEPHKRPSVARYRGLASAPYLPVDCDCAANPDRAREDVLRIARMLLHEHDVPPAAVRTFFSGSKGFSLEIPGSLFGGFAPAIDLAERFNRLARTLFTDCPTLDTAIYESLRLWRWPNSRHGKTGLFKIRLTFTELERLSLDDIRALAAAPRALPDDAPDDDWNPRAGLAAAWDATTKMAALKIGHRLLTAGVAEGMRPLTDADAEAVVTLMTEHWDAGQKHHVAMGLAGWFVSAGVPEAQAERLFRVLSADDRRPNDRLGCLRDSYQRRRLGLSIAGPSRLREHLPDDDMEVLGRLLGDSRAVTLVGPLRVTHHRLRVREVTHA